jgi:hypothetical protein
VPRILPVPEWTHIKLRGVFQGGATSTLDASVHMTRLDPRAGARA